MKKIVVSLLLAGSLGWSLPVFAQGDYPTLSQLNQRLQALGNQSSAELTSLTKTTG